MFHIGLKGGKHDKFFLSETTGWIVIKLGRNDHYMVLFNSCSNGSGQLYI